MDILIRRGDTWIPSKLCAVCRKVVSRETGVLAYRAMSEGAAPGVVLPAVVAHRRCVGRVGEEMSWPRVGVWKLAEATEMLILGWRAEEDMSWQGVRVVNEAHRRNSSMGGKVRAMRRRAGHVGTEESQRG